MPVSAVLDRPMSVAEFLDWGPGDGSRYQLIDGRPEAMPTGSRAHSIMVAAIGSEIRYHLRNKPRCLVGSEAGIVPPMSDRSWFVADIAVSCVPHHRGDIATPEPILIVEVLSPGTEAEDREVKLPAYQAIPSLLEIALVAQDRAAVTMLRRSRSGAWTAEETTGLDAVLRLDSIDLSVPLAELYRGLEIDEG